MVIGNLVGKLTKQILKKSAAIGSVKTYCISFSLGAHMCGFIGKEIKLTGIIGLDPSKHILETSTSTGRLSKTDAKAVFVFHTNTRWIGIKRPIGDVDFYVNGGKYQYGVKHLCGKWTRGVLTNCHHMYGLCLL